MRAPRMRERHLACLLALAGLLAVLLPALAWASATGAGSDRLTVVARNLDNPRKIFVGAGGALYVVEAGDGIGPTTPATAARCHVGCVGRTGEIVRIAHGVVTPVVRDLGSTADLLGQDGEGPSAVLVRGGTYYVLMDDMNINAQGVNELGLSDAGDLIRLSAAGRPHVIANLGVFEARHNPDHGAGPGPRFAQPSIDSNPYDVVPFRGGFAVVDAAANDLLWIAPNGRISLLAVFPIQHERLSDALMTGYRVPASMRSFPVQSVPTCVAVGPDGALYVGELTGWPYQAGRARIWRIVPGHEATLYASGFTNISDIAFDGRDLLVLEIASHGLLDPSSTGALIRLAPNGSRRLIASAGLVQPTGLALANGRIYISNDGSYPGSGRGPHGELVSLPASAAA